VLKLFRQRWFLNRDHLVANVLSAQRDDAGHFTWVDFLPPFHTHLVQRMLALLPPLCPVAKGKKVMFSFILEVLDGKGDSSFFDLARSKPKKTRPRRQKCEKASSSPSPAPPPSDPAPAVEASPPAPASSGTGASAPSPAAVRAESPMAVDDGHVKTNPGRVRKLAHARCYDP
jgi:hypothetical protein